MLVHWTQHTTSPAPSASGHIFEYNHRVVHRPAEGQSSSSIVMRGAPPASPSPAALMKHMALALQGRSINIGRECDEVRAEVGAKSGANREWNNSNREAHTEQNSSPIPRTAHRLEPLEQLERLVGTQGDSTVTRTIPHASENRPFARHYAHVHNSLLRLLRHPPGMGLLARPLCPCARACAACSAS